MKFKNVLRKLGIFRKGKLKATYKNAKERPIELQDSGVFNSKKDLIKFKKKKTNFFNQIDLKNPFHWWGFILVIVGVTSGGVIGGGLGGLCGITIINLGNKTHFSITKKLTLSILITIGGIIGYVILASIFLSFLNS